MATSRYIRTLTIMLAMFLGAVPASAQISCAFCNTSVRFDEALAICFETELPNQLAQVPKLGDFTVVNLAACGEQQRTRSGLPIELPEGQEAALLDPSFVISNEDLVCLGKAVADRSKPLAKPHVYVLADLCH